MPHEASAIVIGRYAAPAAYLLHNLALASANEFVSFNELEFWQLIAAWDSRFPELGLGSFRNMFELDLAGA